MNGYTENLTLSMENSRNCLGRIARHDDTEFSNQSIRNSMEKFVKSVNVMDDTILVPCRLMDLKVGDDTDATPPPLKKHGTKSKHAIREILSSADLYDLYNMINTVKVDLLWGQNTEEDTETPIVATTAAIASTTVKGHVRRPSTVSMASTNSAVSVISDSESDAGNENDSGIEEPPAQSPDNTLLVAQNFRCHLLGLQRSLRQLTDAAEYLTTRYQQHVGGPV